MEWSYVYHRLALGLIDVAVDNQMVFFREQTHEDAKGGVIWEGAVKDLVRYLVADGGGWAPVEEEGGC